MRILAVSCLRDEGPHLLEWVAHHRAAGVTDFLLFSNDCSDGTDAMLDALAPVGVVHVRNVPPPGKSVQWNALHLAWRHELRRAADWILHIDCDEFVNLRAPLGGLADLVARCDGADAIVLPWRLFGHSGRARLEDGRSTALFTRAAPPGCAYPVGATQFKTLLRRKGPFARLGVHRPRAKKGQHALWVDGSGRALPAALAQNEKRITLFGLREATELVQLNHYALRSAESFLLKRARGLPNRKGRAIDLMYWVERNFNNVEDRSIARMSAATEAALAEIAALPGIAELHSAALARHRAAFEALMKDPAELQLYGRCLLAAGSTPLSRDKVADLVRRYGAAHG